MATPLFSLLQKQAQKNYSFDYASGTENVKL
jgi:hypothetical protein